MTQLPLAGRVAIVTGASRGIGAATARALAQAGARVVLAARSERALTALADEMNADGGGALAIPTDVCDAASVRGLVEQTLGTFGRLDAAVNSAADASPELAPLADVAVEDYDRMVAVTLRGVFLSMKYEIPAMLRSGGGSIVNLASAAAVRAVDGLAGYVSSKFGVVGLTRTAALDYAGSGIRVNALAPGPVLTEQLRHAGAQAADQAARSVPARRVARPHEVAAAAVWLCSPTSSFITGATLPIDGGLTAGVLPSRAPADHA